MSNRCPRESIQIVGDFVCEVIADHPAPAEMPASRGRSEGVHVVNEFVVDLGVSAQNDSQTTDEDEVDRAATGGT